MIRTILMTIRNYPPRRILMIITVHVVQAKSPPKRIATAELVLPTSPRLQVYASFQVQLPTSTKQLHSTTASKMSRSIVAAGVHRTMGSPWKVLITLSKRQLSMESTMGVGGKDLSLFLPVGTVLLMVISATSMDTQTAYILSLYRLLITRDCILTTPSHALLI